MRQAIFTIAMFASVLAPSAHAQTAVDIFGNILGLAAGEVERQEQQRQYAQQLEQHERSLWQACTQGDVTACQDRARYRMSDKARRALEQTHAKAIADRDAFSANHMRCQHGTIAACDRALAYPYAWDVPKLQSWRTAAHVSLELEKRRAIIARLKQNCDGGQLSACDEALARHDHSNDDRRAFAGIRRSLFGKVTGELSAPAPKLARSPPRTQDEPTIVTGPVPAKTKPLDGNTDSFISVFILVAAATATLAYVALRTPDPLAHQHGAVVLFRNVRRMFEGRPNPRQETRIMLDDRQLLVRGSDVPFRPPPLPSLPDEDLVMKPGHDEIKLKIRREQATGLTGKVTFSVNFIAELSPEAREAVRRYRFGKTVLYSKDPELAFTVNMVRLLWQMFWLWLTRKRWQITIADLVGGRTIECKDILEVLDVEERIMTAAKQFALVLRAASWFGGEQVVEL